MYKQINQAQRYELSALIKAGNSKAAIALKLGVHKSSVYRELKRNSDDEKYHPAHAEEYTKDRKVHRRAPRRFTKRMKAIVEEKLKNI